MPDPWHILAEIADERQRQVDIEGNTPSMDDNEGNAQLARAAAAYAIHSAESTYSDQGTGALFRSIARRVWPWSEDWYKPKDPRRNLIRAGALIVAEIERLDRAAARATSTPDPGEADGAAR